MFIPMLGASHSQRRLSLRPNAFPKQLEKLPDPPRPTAAPATSAPSVAESEAEAEWLGTWAVNRVEGKAKTTWEFTLGLSKNGCI